MTDRIRVWQAAGRYSVCLALALGCGAFACDRATDVVPDPAVDDARGRSTRLALELGLVAADTARALAARPRSTCRLPLEPGAMTAETQVTIALKGVVGQSRRYDQVRQWTRDANGNVASHTRLVVPLPDGRRSERTAELRRVDGQRWSALDGRFADANRVPDFDERIDAEAYRLVDDVLSRVASDAGTVRSARGNDGLCRPIRGHEPITADLEGSVSVSATERTGHVRWTDDEGARLHVVFAERTRRGAGPVVAPDEVWPVDADRGFAVTMGFVDLARESGWLTPGDDTLVIAPSVADE